MNRRLDPIKDFTTNRNRVPQDVIDAEMRDHNGEIALRSRDGTHTYGYAATTEAVYKKLEEIGLKMNEVVLDCVSDGSTIL